MAAYNGAILTNDGIDILNQAIAGEITLNFKYLKTGDGTYTDTDKTPAAIRLMTDLKSPVQQVGFNSSTIETDQFVQLKSTISNADLTSGYQLTELGIYVDKGDGTDALYCVITTNDSDFMPPYNGKNTYEIILSILIKVNDASTVTVTYTPQTYALAEDLQETRDSIPTKVSQLENDTGYALETELQETKDSIPTKISQLQNDTGYALETELQETKDSIPTKVSQLDNDAGYIARQNVPTAFIKDVSFAYSTSDAAYKATLTFYSLSDGTETTELSVLPLATETTSGIMPKEMYAQVIANVADINLLKGHAVRYPAHLGTQTPTDAQLTAIVTSAGGSLEDGVTVIDLDYSKEYTYFATDSDWHDMGQTTVTVGTLTSLGVVMGSEASGKIYIEADGTMSLIGYDAIITAINGKAPTSHASTGTTYGRSTSAKYGHAKASSTTPLVADTAAVGTDDGTYARGDHVHPSQSSISGNAGSATKLATSRTIDGVSFDGTAAITHYGTCSTAAATAAKTVSLTGFTLVTGAQIAVKFTVTNTAASPTLNVNDTGAKPIRWRGAAVVASILTANRVYDFVYDGSGYELVGDAYSAATASNYGIAKASTATPLVASTAAVGTDDGTYARGDHVHPSQSTVSGNAGSATKLATSRTIDGVTFDGSAAITHYGKCSTAAATAAKVVSLTGFTLVTGAQIAIKFTVTNTAASPTLNVNNTGAKPIRLGGTDVDASILAAGRVYEIVYDGSGYEITGTVYSAATDTNLGLVKLSDEYNSVLSGVPGLAASQKAVAGAYAEIKTTQATDNDAAWDIINSIMSQGRDLTVVFAAEINNYSDEWAWIQARLNAHNLSDLRIGDYIQINVAANRSIPAETHKAEIAGINTYRGTTDIAVLYHIDWITRDCYSGTVQFNTTDTNNGNASNSSPYVVSNLRSWLNSTLYGLLDTKLKSAIKSKRTLVPYRYQSGVTLTDDYNWGWEDIGKLWVPFEVEIFGYPRFTTKGYGSCQNVQYPIFAHNSGRYVKGNGPDGARVSWWTASVGSGTSINALPISREGHEYNYYNASRSLRVPICFRTIED
jgi:hypothetical protein